jgi:hypothetical protein
MTLHFDPATLFLAPAARPGTGSDDRTPPAADHRAEAMDALCHPFTVRPEFADVPVR